jgi:hypothetical protein
LRGRGKPAAKDRHHSDRSRRGVRVAGYVTLVLACTPAPAAASETLDSAEAVAATTDVSEALPGTAPADSPVPEPSPAPPPVGEPSPDPGSADPPAGQPPSGPPPADPPAGEPPSGPPPADAPAGQPSPSDPPSNDRPTDPPPADPVPTDPGPADPPPTEPAPTDPRPADSPTPGPIADNPRAVQPPTEGASERPVVPGVCVAAPDTQVVAMPVGPATPWKRSVVAHSRVRPGPLPIDAPAAASDPSSGWLTRAGPIALQTPAPSLQTPARAHVGKDQAASAKTAVGRRGAQHDPAPPADPTGHEVGATAATGNVAPPAVSCALLAAGAARAGHELRRLRAPQLVPNAPGVFSLRDRPG